MCTGKPLATALALAFALPAVAGDDTGAVGTAMGSVGAADPVSNDMVTLNPGLLELQQRYDVAGEAGIGRGGWELGASAVDSREATVAMGISYRRVVTDPPLTSAQLPGWVADGETYPNVHRSHRIGLALAAPAADHRLSFGLGGNLDLSHDDREPWLADGDLHAGMGWAPEEWLVVGVVADNLLPVPKHDETPFTAGVGIRALDEDVGAFEIDVHERIEGGPSTVLAVGGDKTLEKVALRAGWRWDQAAGLHSLTLGTGIRTTAGSVDFAFAFPLNAPFAHAWFLQVGVRLWT
jgi:hypothetical protein